MEIKLSNISSKFASENKKTIDKKIKNLLCYTLPPAQTAKAVSARSRRAKPAHGPARMPGAGPAASRRRMGSNGHPPISARQNRRPVHPPQNPSALFSIPQLSRLPSRVRRRPSPARRDRPAPSPWSRARARRLPFSELHGGGRPWRPATLAVGASEGRHRWIQSSRPRAILSFPSLF